MIIEFIPEASNKVLALPPNFASDISEFNQLKVSVALI